MMSSRPAMRQFLERLRAERQVAPSDRIIGIESAKNAISHACEATASPPSSLILGVIDTRESAKVECPHDPRLATAKARKVSEGGGPGLSALPSILKGLGSRPLRILWGEVHGH